ncbi:hypothetical protein SAMN05216184_11197 [Georgenia satyanarayanai]|uniref:Uncharacterized protein n=1 Tax=Georgenia satyanarayanai TaxID=860221 RepID=A0A2Y9ARI8_9MICO|nr:hypothetical protein [Georgenia satyanarayanai]PYF98440.1 hypothetical protein A8987_11197 [Georgenia satyanarayanai]SSA45107.1 hypothetical protein SAMN05216184_11197 [Georgenia satyanarayanai]
METYDSTVKLARALRPGDVLVGVGPRGERLVPVREASRTGGEVVVVTDEQTLRLRPRDEVRVAHPDVAGPPAPEGTDPARGEADATAPTSTA